MQQKIYKFALPTNIMFCINESNISIEDIMDLEDLQKKYDIDLQYVIDEYEYKMENDILIGDLDDYDDIEMNEIEIFNSVISDLWDDITESFKTNVKLNKINNENIQKIYEITSKDFNNNKFKTDKIFTIKMVDIDKQNSCFIVNAISNDELSENEIEDIRKFIDNQCSDGWGEAFENIDLSDILKEEDRTVFVKIWQPNSEVKFIN